jgi:hypothetical protein
VLLFPKPLAPATQSPISTPDTRDLVPDTCALLCALLLTPGWSFCSLCQSSYEKACERGNGGRNRPEVLIASKIEKDVKNSGNELKDLLIAKELAFSRAKNELVIARKNAQTKSKNGAKTRKIETGKWKLVARTPGSGVRGLSSEKRRGPQNRGSTLLRFSSFHFLVSDFYFLVCLHESQD